MTQTAITPNPDSLAEVRVLQDNYSPKYSLMGNSVVMLQTKSGSTEFHGGAFEYFRNNDLNARNFFSLSVPTLKQNIWGYTLGGPVLIPRYHGTQKTFFFVTEQWVDSHNASVLTGATPTSDQRNGLFTTAIKDPRPVRISPRIAAARTRSRPAASIPTHWPFLMLFIRCRTIPPTDS